MASFRSGTHERGGVFALTWFLYNFAYWMVLSYLPVHLAGLGLDGRAIGYLMATPQIITLCAVLPFGYLSDRIAARRLSQLGLVLVMLWILGLTVLDKGPCLVALFGLSGLGMCLHLVSFNSLFLKHINQENRGRKVGAFVFAQFAGYSLGPLAMPAAQWGAALMNGEPAAAFYVPAAVVAACLSLTFLLRDPAPMPFHFSEYIGDVRSRRGVLVTGLIVLYTLHFGCEQAFYPVFLRNQCGLSQFGVGTVFAYSGMIVATVAFVSGRLFDSRQRMFSAMALCMVLSGVFHGLTGLCSSMAEVLAVRTLHTIADGTLNCYITLFVAVTFPRHRLGGNFGFVNAIRTIGIVVGAAASGHLVVLAGLSAPFFATGLPGAIAGLTFLAFRSRLKPIMGETG